MSVPLETVVLMSRGCCGTAVFAAALVPHAFLSLLGIGRSIQVKGTMTVFMFLVALCLLNAATFFAIVIEALKHGSLPDPAAAICETALVLATLIHAEQLHQNNGKSSAWIVRTASWVLLLTSELLALGRLGLMSRHGISLALQIAVAICMVKIVSYAAIIQHTLPIILDAYGAVTVSSPISPLTVNSIDDILGLQMEREAKKLGGWWPLIKRFGVFFEILPMSQPLQIIQAAASLILLVLGQIVSVQEQLAFASLFDAAAAGSNVWQPLKASLLLWMANVLLPFLHGMLRMDSGLRRAKAFTVGVHAKILSLDPVFHSLTNPTDLTKITDNSKDLVDLVDSVLFTHLTNAVGLLFTARSLIRRYGPLIFVVIIYQVIFTALIDKIGVEKRAEASSQVQKAKLFQERRRQDALRGWTTLFNNNQVQHEIERFKSVADCVIEQQRKLDFLRLTFCLLRSLIGFCGIAAGYALIIYQYGQGSTSIGDLMAFMSVWGGLWSRFNDLIRVVPDTLDAFMDAAPLRRVLERTSTTETRDAELKCPDGGLELRHVSYSYPGRDKRIIDGLNLSIKPRSKVALIGPSGTGKSTLLGLFMRHLSPTIGAVIIDGQDTREVRKDSFHDSVGMMPQIPHMFNATVMENIKVGKAEATDEEVYQACRMAVIHDAIMSRPEGYKTHMGEHGGSFSGGEKQRMEFARLFLKKPKIVILDEPTASLDAESESKILQNLMCQFGDVTIIVTTHQLRLIQDFDRIIFIGSGGKILEDGHHDELLARNGKYAEYCQAVKMA